jgi:DNA-binding transcriptional ArsR family regulator
MLPTFATASGSNSNRGELSEDEIYEVLSNRRRRFVIHALKRTEEPIEIFELSQYITAWETGVELEEVSSKHRRNVYSTLQRTHLPKLEKKNVVTVDKERNYVQATPKLKNLEIYVEVLGSKEIPWSLYYVGLAGVAVSLLIAVMIDTPVFGAFYFL